MTVQPMQERRDLAANWTALNPVPLNSQWCVEADTGKAKLGDGVTPWSQLPYFGGAVASVNDKDGAVVLTAADVDADTAGSASAAQSAAEIYAAAQASAAQSAAIAASDPAGSAAAAQAASLPVTQTFPLSNNTYRKVFDLSVTGQTDDPLAPFGAWAASKSYQRAGTPPGGGTYPVIQGPFIGFGYNTQKLVNTGLSSAHGAVGFTVFGDAGDTNNNAGGHGLEFNIAFITADGSAATGGFQFIATDDNTNTAYTKIRCGTGTSNGVQSSISFLNGDESLTYMSMGPGNGDAVAMSVPLNISGASLLHRSAGGGTATFQDTSAGYTFSVSSAGTTTASFGSSGGPASLSVNSSFAGALTKFQVQSVGASGTAQIYLNSALENYLIFQFASVNKWAILHTSSSFGVFDYVNSRFMQSFTAGTTAPGSLVEYASKVKVDSSLVVGTAALGLTATDGYLYLPTAAGTSTATPTAQTGTAPAYIDTTNSKLMVNVLGTWKGVALA